jgi:hypothetical protein
VPTDSARSSGENPADIEGLSIRNPFAQPGTRRSDARFFGSARAASRLPSLRSALRGLDAPCALPIQGTYRSERSELSSVLAMRRQAWDRAKQTHHYACDKTDPARQKVALGLVSGINGGLQTGWISLHRATEHILGHSRQWLATEAAPF